MKISMRNAGIALGLAAIAALAVIPSFSRQQNPLSEYEKQRVNFRHSKTGSVKVNAPHKLVLGKAAPDFSFTNLNGEVRKFSDLNGGPALFFLADTTCPCVKAYNGRIKAMQRKYAAQGFRVVYLYPQAEETRAQIAAYNKANGFEWESAIDSQQKLLRLFDGRCSSEAYLFDGKGVLRYHGALDDSNFDERKVAKRYVENALQAILAGKPVGKTEVATMGCEIPRIRA